MIEEDVASYETDNHSRRYAVLEEFFSMDVLCEPWEIDPSENDLLRIPERRLPRTRRLLNRMRLVILFAAIVRVLFFVMAGGQYVMLLAEVVLGMIALGVATLLVTRAHVRDVQDVVTTEEILSLPDGSPKLAQALFLRPFGELLHLVAHYYAFVVCALLIDTTVIVYLMGPLHDHIDMLQGCMLVALLLHFPWMCLVLVMIMSSINRGVRYETIQGGHAPWARFWEYCCACVHFDSLLFVWVWLTVGVMFAGFINRSLLIFIPAILLTISVHIVFGSGRTYIRRRFQSIVFQLSRDLDDHWQEQHEN